MGLALTYLIDIACFLDLERMCDDSLVLYKAEDVEVAENLTDDENVIASEKKRCNVRLLHSHLPNLLVVLKLVDHD